MTVADASPRLAIFDMDGTLVDSQVHIVGAMRRAFAAVKRTPPARETILSIVGLSLPVAIARLAPDLPRGTVEDAAQAYREAFVTLRADGGAPASPLYPGALEALDGLAGDGMLLGIATGKSRRGLTHVLEATGLGGRFVTTQVADDHPSKPHPSMIHAALRETGVAAADAIMIGDTVFDVEMAVAAGVRSVGVAWGYHKAEDLRRAGAALVVERFGALIPALDAVWARAA